ncbi:MAG: hypothetical protein JWQ96_2153, partial [Segetibacter sp.]|nr:hypothetical protein [Segetibacter sp.]
NKKIKCSSISTNGSEFTISPAVGTISSATGIGCTTQFDTDSLHLQLPQFLPPGSFTLRIKNGDDNNTLLDYCDNTIDATEELKFTVLPKAPTPFDSLAPVKCAPNKLVVVFAKPVLCSSIATNGSDFSINGSYPTSIASATPNCTGTTTREVVVTLSNTLQQAGTFTLTLAKGSDGNAVVDECGEETPAGRSISFSVKDTVDASFTYKIGYGCTKDTVQYFHAAGNGVNSWKWSLDESQSSQQQNATSLYSVFNEKTIQLIVNNGFCTDTSTQKVKLANFLKADFTTYNDNCPNEPVPFTSTAVGKVTVHSWAFGDGGTANTASPTHSYAPPTRETAFTVRYTVTDSFGCQSTMQKKTNIYTSCYLAVPSAFTPNGDGLNDFFHPLNAIKAEQLTFAIFNRWGELIFKTGDWKQGWNGRQNDKPLGSGSYVWLLSYVDRDTRKRVEQKGTVVLIR